MFDTNNNSIVGKYSLRPRGVLKRSAEDGEEDDVKSLPRSRKTSRQRSQPLSKYRRRSANARERSRMREINEAFETLRRMVSCGSENQTEKTTKISTLRLAMGYITALSDALRSPSSRPEAGDRLHGDVTEESSRAEFRARPIRVDSKLSTLTFQNVSRTSSSDHSEVIVSSSVVKPNICRNEKPTIKNSTVSINSSNIQIQTNSKYEVLRSSSDDFLQEACLPSTDGYVNERKNSLPRTVDDLVEEFNCDFIQSTKGTYGTSSTSPACSFHYVKPQPLNKPSLPDFGETDYQLLSVKTLDLNMSTERGRAVVEPEPVFEEDPSVVELELPDIPMSHISLEELFNE